MSTQGQRSNVIASNQSQQLASNNASLNSAGSSRASSRRKNLPSEQEIRTHIVERATNTKYRFLKSVQRNIAVIGRTRGGKTTFVEVIRDEKYVPPPLQLYSGTRDIEVRHIAAPISQENSGIMYNINIIDTPGFFDTGDGSSGRRVKRFSNEDIKMLLDKCITEEVTQIHIFAFVFSVENGINSQDVESMIFFKENYPDLRPFVALILTHCEDKDESATQALIEGFFSDERVSLHDLRRYFGLGVHCSGSINPQHVKSGLRDTVDFELDNVDDMREEFLDFVVRQEAYFNIHDNSSSCSIL